MFPADDLSAIRRCLLGVDRPIRHAVLSPSNLVFDAVSEGMELCRGWWPSAWSGSVMICRTPQGSPVIDAVAALPDDTAVTFIGFCGALGGQQIGDVIDPQHAHLENALYYRTHSSARRQVGGAVVTVSCFAAALMNATALRSIASSVDMETGHVFATAVVRRLPVRALMVVSDSVPDRPFYRTTRDHQRLAVAVRKLCRDVRSELLPFRSVETSKI